VPDSGSLKPRITRRRFLQAAVGGAAWVALVGALGCDPVRRARATASSAPAGQAWSFRSRPDLHPPVIEVTTRARDTAPGRIFVAPKNGPDEAGPGQDGCMILGNDGQPVWLRLLQNEDMDAMNFKVQTYKGETVLTWWEGHHTGYGQGEYVICDHSYREIKRFGAGNGYEGDHHEFLITPQDTALITIYNKVPGDSVLVGDPVDGNVLDGIAQEVDIETGEVLFEWHSLEHVGLDNSYTKPYDYFHINSIDVYDEDHLLISSRNTCTVYKVDRKTGKIVWRLGGKKNDFEMAEGTQFAFQHDARRHPDGTITIFNNGNINIEEQSRGIVVEVDEDKMSVTLAREFTYPDKLLSETQGNVQVLPNGNAFVGWGSAPAISEFNRAGELLFSAAFPTEGETYRAFRFPWSGQPTDDPAVAAELGSEHEVTLYASWNGATEVYAWQVLAGSGPDELDLLASAPHRGFETVITVHTTEPFVGLKAMNNSGKVLGTTRTIKLQVSA
jgi:outer membrane protein assembly factor BamB